MVGVGGGVFAVAMSMSDGNGAVAAQEPVVISRSEGSGAVAAQGVSLSSLPLLSSPPLLLAGFLLSPALGLDICVRYE